MSDCDICRTDIDGAAEAPRSYPAEDSDGDAKLPVSVIICAYTEKRWELTRAAIESALNQRPRPVQVLLVVDHNADLAARARRELSTVTVLENDGPAGLCGARNTGLRTATEPIAVFLDDDAEARPGWLTSLVEPYSRDDVMATGGSIRPWWQDSRPRWIPPAFDWVVGCTYVGLPEAVGRVRSPIGANMSLRTRPALEVGGFNTSVGQRGGNLQRGDETELVIRLAALRPGSVVLHVPTAAVDHHVGKERLKFSYFLRRCWHEGLSKAVLVGLVGAPAGLEAERRYVTVVLPATLLRDFRSGATGDLGGFMRMAATIGGLTVVTVGYLTGRANHLVRRS
jgi:Glycosyl transferase family 2